MKLSINWLSVLIIPVWIWALIQTYGTPTFWVLVILAIKDLGITTTFNT